MFLKSLTLFISFALVVPAFAYSGFASDFEKKNVYYLPPTKSEKSSDQNISLLQLKKVDQKFPRPQEKYDRDKHYGKWISISKESSCLNTREVVLKRSSSPDQIAVSKNGCRILRGEWLDPYTDQQFTNPKDIQIDHMVPLKNSYISGGYQWSQQKRCAYANYLGNSFHLLAVSGDANEEKLDHSPKQYMPPNKAYHCQYLKDWLQIKLIWELAMSEDEVTAIQDLMKESNCDPQEFRISKAELQEQRKKIEAGIQFCASKLNENNSQAGAK